MVVKQFMMSLLIVAALAYSSVSAVTESVINGFSMGKRENHAAE